MRIGHIDGVSGVAGDMLLGAIVDAGLPAEALREAVRGLGLGRAFELSFAKTSRRGLAATHAVVTVRAGAPAPRTLSDVHAVLDGAALDAAVRAQAGEVFRLLAEAEGAVHGAALAQVHFHEVGAIDALVDVVGVVAGLRLLGAERVTCGPLAVGRGEIRSAHGALPSPGPATMKLLEGLDVRPVETDLELVTPTGAALVRGLAGRTSAPPPMRISATGYGAGTADPPGRANVVRLWLGDVQDRPAGASEDVVMLEANVDDQSAELIAAALERALAAGALDAFSVPCQMKKGRPGAWLHVLTTPGDAARLERLLFRETTTLGIRRRRFARTALRREVRTVELDGAEVRIKCGWLGDELVTQSPELEDVRALAAQRELAVRDVYERVRRAAQSRFGEP
jgi:uncharacterized protein (TIGR00299 family) protein